MQNKKFLYLKRTFALILSLVLMIGAVLMPSASAKSLEQLQQEYENAQAEIDKNEQKVENILSEKLKNEKELQILSSKAESISVQLNAINAQMQIINADIKKIDDEIAALDKKIYDTKTQISNVKDDIEDTQKLVAKRISASYMAGNASWIEMMLEADSLPSLLLRMQFVSNITKKDNELVDKLRKETKKLEKLEDGLSKDKKKCEDKRKGVVAKRDELDDKAVALSKKQNEFNDNYYKISNLMKTLDKNSEAYKAEIKKQKDKRDAFALQIDQILQNGSQSGDGSSDDYYNDGEMMWPVPYKNSYISAGYGYYDPDEDGIMDFHPAIDIVVRQNGQNVSYGKRIVAAQSGRVIARGYSDVGGNYVTIDHGDGYRTYYGHCSKVHVSSGAVVQKGQHIADIGATGYVTGPHVHFQVMKVVNGQVQRLNPLNFVTPPNN